MSNKNNLEECYSFWTH